MCRVSADRPVLTVLELRWSRLSASECGSALYSQFYSEDEFCHYNMFNHHFFNGEPAEAVYKAFLRQDDGEKVVMVTDPPFGGLVKPLAHSFSRISDTWKSLQTPENSGQEMPMVWIFPYFFESRILECFPSFSMMDYQVDYDNHPLYKHGKTGRKQSPSGSSQTCVHGTSSCQRMRATGSAQRARDMCPLETGTVQNVEHALQRTGGSGDTVSCVRTWLHCPVCERCALPDHPCGRGQAGCFSCGSQEHKRRACPHSAKHGKNRGHAAGKGRGTDLSKQTAGRTRARNRKTTAQGSKKRRVT
ncbi:hypothetical protein MATL_G00196600 [Megalops atlanticus]|uniref:Zinc finger CCHC domain-containing protein 4 n=1 Tax=Megalops atlanticus TaxID=7932 RepID=A0A9D3SZC6_MEGAT|nr:hypothetical protein MATL_G00196600 [Megalops atlanticus]